MNKRKNKVNKKSMWGLTIFLLALLTQVKADNEWNIIKSYFIAPYVFIGLGLLIFIPFLCIIACCIRKRREESNSYHMCEECNMEGVYINENNPTITREIKYDSMETYPPVYYCPHPPAGGPFIQYNPYPAQVHPSQIQYPQFHQFHPEEVKTV